MASEPDPAADVVALVLEGLSVDRDLDELEATVRLSHRRDSTFPGAALLELAADAYVVGGWTRRDRLVVDGLDRLLPERPARGNVGTPRGVMAFMRRS